MTTIASKDLLLRQRTFSIDETREQLQQGRPVQRLAVVSGAVDYNSMMYGDDHTKPVNNNHNNTTNPSSHSHDLHSNTTKKSNITAPKSNSWASLVKSAAISTESGFTVSSSSSISKPLVATSKSFEMKQSPSLSSTTTNTTSITTSTPDRNHNNKSHNNKTQSQQSLSSPSINILKDKENNKNNNEKKKSNNNNSNTNHTNGIASNGSVTVNAFPEIEKVATNGHSNVVGQSTSALVS